MPRPISKTSARLLSGVTLPVLVLACVAGPAPAQTVEGSGGNRVMMFERPPTVDELREAVKPGTPPTGDAEQPKIRTRSIEIVGGGMSSANRPRPTDSVNYGAPASQQIPQQSYVPQTAPAPVAQPEPAPQPKPKRAPVQEAAAPPAAPPPVAPRRSNGVQPATLSAPETQAETRPANGFGFRINFAFNSADVPREFYSYIDAVGGLMSQDPQLRLVIEGHTDAVGSEPYNLALSERRAVSVGEYLVRVHHIEPQRIAIAGLGKSQPLTPDPTDSRNRRVEFRPIQ